MKTTNITSVLVGLVLALGNSVEAYNAPTSQSQSQQQTSRRSFLNSAAITAVSLPFVGGITPTRALAADESGVQEDVYFGVGCFWHIQHEFVEAERTLLGRSDVQLTSRTGYAGGKSLDKEGRVCYHNFQGIADYGKLGHAEVVGMTIPQKSIPDFATEYFNLFSKNGDRVDPMDVGPEYRSLLGLPGGSSHELYPKVVEAAESHGLKLVEGRGNDPDTLFRKTVYVMDTKQYPFHQAEVYHQFHNDFQSRPYGKAYNSLVNTDFLTGPIEPTGCPDRV